MIETETWQNLLTAVDRMKIEYKNALKLEITYYPMCV